MEQVKKLSPALFGIIIFSFFLPFVNLSCGGQTIVSLTGFELITGTEIDQKGMFNQNQLFDTQEMDQQKPEQVDAEPLALAAFIAAVLSLFLSLIKVRSVALICMITSILGALFLILLKVKLDDNTLLNQEVMIQINYLFAYWFSFILFLAGAFLQWSIYSEKTIQRNVLEDPKAV